MKKILAFICALVPFTFISCDDDLQLDDSKINDYEYNFEFLWKEIDEKYCFFDYKKDSIKDWNDVHDEYLPYVRECKDEMQFFDVLGAMLNELKDGHVNLMSFFDKSHYDIEKNKPADYDCNLMNYSNRYLGYSVRSCEGFKYKTMRDGKVGYIRYESFMDYLSDDGLDYILKYFQNTDGLIIDVRNNGGGAADYVNVFVSHFIKEKVVAAYFMPKIGKGHSDFSSPIKSEVSPAKEGAIYEKPVYILTNRMCFSATNNFLYAMKGLPRVKLMGGRSGGGAGLPHTTELPIGWSVRFSGSIMYDRNLNITEFGIDPDIEIHLDEELARTQGLDNIIETACDYIEGKIK